MNNPGCRFLLLVRTAVSHGNQAGEESTARVQYGQPVMLMMPPNSIHAAMMAAATPISIHQPLRSPKNMVSDTIIYQVDPILYPKCSKPMRVIAYIEDHKWIKKILSHLGLWETRNPHPPQTTEKPIPAPITDLTLDDTCSQLP